MDKKYSFNPQFTVSDISDREEEARPGRVGVWASRGEPSMPSPRGPTARLNRGGGGGGRLQAWVVRGGARVIGPGLGHSGRGNGSDFTFRKQ